MRLAIVLTFIGSIFAQQVLASSGGSPPSLTGSGTYEDPYIWTLTPTYRTKIGFTMISDNTSTQNVNGTSVIFTSGSGKFLDLTETFDAATGVIYSREGTLLRVVSNVTRTVYGLSEPYYVNSVEDSALITTTGVGGPGVAPTFEITDVDVSFQFDEEFYDFPNSTKIVTASKSSTSSNNLIHLTGQPVEVGFEYQANYDDPNATMGSSAMNAFYGINDFQIPDLVNVGFWEQGSYVHGSGGGAAADDPMFAEYQFIYNNPSSYILMY